MEVAGTSRKVSHPRQPTAASPQQRRKTAMTDQSWPSSNQTDQSWLSTNQTLLDTNQWLATNLSSFNAFLNGSYNGTIDDFELIAQSTKLNGTEHGSWFCAKWHSAQQDLFQAANLCFALAFLVPKSFKQSVLVLRALAAVGGVLMSMWAGAEICAPDVLAWSLALALINSTHTVVLIIRFLPPVLSLELTDLYLKMFKPMKVSKKHFQELSKESRIVKLEPGEAYALEEVTPADERLSILLKGKMRVSCDDTLLHYINPYQFVDSPEWEANREHSDDVFQVTVVAEEVCTCVCWPRMRLERVLRHRPGLKVVLDSLIGKDITHKLYSVSEGLSGVIAEREGTAASVRRSASVDAVHEGTRGRVRSDAWRAGSRPSGGLFGPMVARQFLRNSPFSRSVQVPKLVTQTSSGSLQPPPVARAMSPPRRAASFRKTREVKFAEEAEGKV